MCAIRSEAETHASPIRSGVSVRRRSGGHGQKGSGPYQEPREHVYKVMGWASCPRGEESTVFRNPEQLVVSDAFDDRGPDAQLAQSAFLLGTARIMNNEAELVPEGEFMGIDRVSLAQKQRPALSDALESKLNVDWSTVKNQAHPEIYESSSRDLAMETQQTSEPEAAMALIAASTHSEISLVRTSAAAAQAIIEGRSPWVAGILVDSLDSDDDLVVDIAATALAKLDPEDPMLARFEGDDPEEGPQQPLTNTAFITHGTWANGALTSRPAWWEPTGDFFEHIAADPKFHLYAKPFAWSGSYLATRRETAALAMANWITQEGLTTPDMIGHSHGCTVANLATQSVNQTFNRMIMLAWPVHDQWLPDPARIGHIVSFRVKYDLVILVDGGRQSFNPPASAGYQVTEHINGVFAHSDPHEPAYWDQYGLSGLVPPG